MDTHHKVKSLFPWSIMAGIRPLGLYLVNSGDLCSYEIDEESVHLLLGSKCKYPFVDLRLLKSRWIVL